MPPDRIVPPFKLIEHAESFEVKDAGDQRLGTFYFDEDESRRGSFGRVDKPVARALAREYRRMLEKGAGEKRNGTIGESEAVRLRDPD